jgi:hypothetical protein
MHIEKNVIDNILGTILDIKGKTKDNLQARKDLCEMGLRHTLYVFMAENEKIYMPQFATRCPMRIKPIFLKNFKI